MTLPLTLRPRAPSELNSIALSLYVSPHLCTYQKSRLQVPMTLAELRKELQPSSPSQEAVAEAQEEAAVPGGSPPWEGRVPDEGLPRILTGYHHERSHKSHLGLRPAARRLGTLLR